jgi:hypothetical protein
MNFGVTNFIVKNDPKKKNTLTFKHYHLIHPME